MEINKGALTAKAAVSDEDLLLINRQTLREMTAEDVYVFKVRACDTRVDRDLERFTEAALVMLAKLFVGKTVIFDHKWSAGGQTARIFATAVEEDNDCHVLMAKCYMLRNDSTKDTIADIEGGILREVSVGCAISRAVCSICGKEYGTCGHQKGEIYDGNVCVCELHDPVDAHEMSFVAVPAQPLAGVTKGVKNKSWSSAEHLAAKAQLEIEQEKWRYL